MVSVSAKFKHSLNFSSDSERLSNFEHECDSDLDLDLNPDSRLVKFKLLLCAVIVEFSLTSLNTAHNDNIPILSTMEGTKALILVISLF